MVTNEYFLSGLSNQVRWVFKPVLGCILGTFTNGPPPPPLGLVSATSVCRETEHLRPSTVTGDVRDCLLTVIWNIDALEKELHRTGNLHSSQTTQRALEINKVSTRHCSFVENHFQIFLFELLNRPCQNNSDYYPIHRLQHQAFM